MFRRTSTQTQLQTQLTRSTHDVFQLHDNFAAHNATKPPVVQLQVGGILAQRRSAFFQRETNRE